MTPFEVLWLYRRAFLGGFAVTCELVGLTVLSGTAIAVALAYLSRRSSILGKLLDGLAFTTSAIPALVILFWLYYPVQTLFDINVPPFWTAFAALLIIDIFGVYRIIVDAASALPRQYTTTALVCGMPRRDIRRYIQLPLLARAALPRWIDQQVVILQTSLFAAFISVEETFRVALRINSLVYRPVVIYTSMAIIFLFAAGATLGYARHLRTRFERDLSER